MNVTLLIDAIVRQTTVLIAQLATAGGVRAPLAHVATQVFIELARELESQGVSRKVSADMFGMALRAYVRKVQRLEESATVRGTSLWEAIYGYIGEQGVASRQQITTRFSRDEEPIVRGVIHDLTESGLVFKTGMGGEAVYRAATEEEPGKMREVFSGQSDELLWAIIYRDGPLTPKDIERLERMTKDPLTSATCLEAARTLTRCGRGTRCATR